MSSELSKNHFELFGLPASYDIDLERLAAVYLDLQRSTHPDRFVNAGDAERRLSMQLAAQVNEAHRILRDPIARGRYLLELRGVSLDDEKDTVMDAGFLMEQMELREALEEVGGSADPLAELGALMTRVETLRATMLQTLRQQLQATETADLVPARDTLRKLQFLRKLADEAQSREADLLDAL